VAAFTQEVTMSEFGLTVGVDWSEEHLDACAVAPSGTVQGEKRFAQDVEGVDALSAWILQLEPEPTRVGVAIELKRGPVVAALLERGFVVAALNPKQLDRFRDRFCVSGAKDDRRDAHALADGLRTDRRAFRIAEPEHPLVVQLREAVRLHHDLTVMLGADCNRLRDQLLRYFPAAVALAGGELWRDWYLELLERVPTRAAALRIRPAHVASLLRKHRVRRLDAQAVLDRLREPTLPLTPGAALASQRHAQLLIERIRVLARQRTHNIAYLENLTDALAEDLSQGQDCEQHDVAILRSLPGVGRIVAAELLAEAWEPLGRRDYAGLRTLAGVAPVTRRSGGKCAVVMRRAANPIVRGAVTTMARVAMVTDPHWAATARDLRQRHAGIRPGHLQRIIGDKMLRVLCAALRDRSSYDPEKLARAA
jgi:transposase